MKCFFTSRGQLWMTALVTRKRREGKPTMTRPTAMDLYAFILLNKSFMSRASDFKWRAANILISRYPPPEEEKEDENQVRATQRIRHNRRKGIYLYFSKKYVCSHLSGWRMLTLGLCRLRSWRGHTDTRLAKAQRYIVLCTLFFSVFVFVAWRWSKQRWTFFISTLRMMLLRMWRSWRAAVFSQRARCCFLTVILNSWLSVGYTVNNKNLSMLCDYLCGFGHMVLQAAFMDEGHFQKTHHTSAGLNGDEYPYGTEECKPVTLSSLSTFLFFSQHFATRCLLIVFIPLHPQKKPTKMKLLHVGRRSSKVNMFRWNVWFVWVFLMNVSKCHFFL